MDFIFKGRIYLIEKITNIKLKIFSFSKNHKILSILLCLLFIMFCVRGVVWLYNDIAYGRFVKVAEMQNTQIGNSHEFIALSDDGALLFLRNGNWSIDDSNIFYNIYHINKNHIKKMETTINAYWIKPIADYQGKIYLLFVENSKTLNKTGKYIFQYDYQNDLLSDNKITTSPYTTNAKCTHLPNKTIAIFGEQPIMNKDQIEYPITIFNPKTMQSEILHKYRKKQEDFVSINLNNDALSETTKLYSYNYDNTDYIVMVKNSGLGKIEISLLNVNNNTMSNIDIDQIEKHEDYAKAHNIQRKIIWLKNNDFLVITYPNFGKYTFFETYSLNNNTIVKKQTKVFHNKGLFHANKISPNNYSVINGNKILFIGGYDGIATTSWINKSCYLYDIDKNKIFRLNDFKYRIKGQKIAPFQNNILIFGGYKNKCIFFDPTPLRGIYLFKPRLIFYSGDK